jgi:hypothetical protein
MYSVSLLRAVAYTDSCKGRLISRQHSGVAANKAVRLVRPNTPGQGLELQNVLGHKHNSDSTLIQP